MLGLRRCWLVWKYDFFMLLNILFRAHFHFLWFYLYFIEKNTARPRKNSNYIQSSSNAELFTDLKINVYDLSFSFETIYFHFRSKQTYTISLLHFKLAEVKVIQCLIPFLLPDDYQWCIKKEVHSRYVYAFSSFRPLYYICLTDVPPSISRTQTYLESKRKLQMT